MSRWFRGFRATEVVSVLVGLAVTFGVFGNPSALASSGTGSTRTAQAGPVWEFPQPVTGVGFAGGNRLWVFLSTRAIAPPNALWEVDTSHHRLLLRIAWPHPALAYGTAPDGAAYVVEGQTLYEWWNGHRQTYRLPVGITVTGLAAVSHQAVWLSFRLGLTGRMEVGLYRLPAAVMVYAHHLAGMANETVDALAAAPDGCWVTSAPRPTLFWVPAVGGPSTYTKLYAQALIPAHAERLAGVGVNARGEGWVSGYDTSGHPAVWAVASGGQVGPVRPLPGVVNMVSTALVVAPNGIGYVGFSAIGGSSGYPGVAGVAPNGTMTAVDWPSLAIPGGGVGAEVMLPDGRIWATMPFSRLLLPLRVVP
jgi:hypothetical protein